MEFFIDNILYVAIFLTVLSFVFLFLRNSQNKNHVIKSTNKLSSHNVQIKLRAYERLTLFLDRIEPIRMLNRLGLHAENVDILEATLIQNIITEYEYNVSQQIYVSDQLWSIIDLVKNTIIDNIVKVSGSLKKKSTVDDFVQEMLKNSKNNVVLIRKAQKLLKKEVRQMSQTQ